MNVTKETSFNRVLNGLKVGGWGQLRVASTQGATRSQSELTMDDPNGHSMRTSIYL
jgi:hypothetical protein